MSKVLQRIGLIMTAFVALGIGQLTFGLSAFATSGTTDVAVDGIVPLEFTPVCSDASAGKAYWKVVNKNDLGVEYAWGNADGDKTTNDIGIGIAPGRGSDAFSTSDLVTSYYAGRNNMTDFAYAGSNEGIVSRNATAAACDDATTPVTPPVVTPTEPADPTCTDGSNASLLNVKWNNDSQIAITTKSGLPLCDDVNLYYSTYRMPDGYDGRGFYPDTTGVANPTAYPQTLLQSYAFTLGKGTYGTWLENVPAPDYCYNVQVDLYYAPEITTVNADGHGTQNIASQIFAPNTDACQPGRGAGTTTPTVTTSTPTVLPNTGAENLGNNVLGSLLTLAFGATSLFGLGLRALRQN